jgi:hypothetical protein
MCVLVLSIYGGYKVVENSETIFRKKKLEWVWKMKKEREKENSNIKWRLSDKIIGKWNIEFGLGERFIAK